LKNKQLVIPPLFQRSRDSKGRFSIRRFVAEQSAVLGGFDSEFQ
jgi:hypothetical protein